MLHKLNPGSRHSKKVYNFSLNQLRLFFYFQSVSAPATSAT